MAYLTGRENFTVVFNWKKAFYTSLVKKIRQVNVSEISQALLFLAPLWIKADRFYYSITLFTVYQKLKIVNIF